MPNLSNQTLDVIQGAYYAVQWRLTDNAVPKL